MHELFKKKYLSLIPCVFILLCQITQSIYLFIYLSHFTPTHFIKCNYFYFLF